MALREMLASITPRKRVCGCSAFFLTREELDGSRVNHGFICCIVPLWYCLMSLIHKWRYHTAKPQMHPCSSSRSTPGEPKEPNG